MKSNFACALISGATAALATAPLMAQEVTLKLHQFLPAQANVPAMILDTWADRVEEASSGRIEIERYPSMQLGGTPPELIDQAIDGVVDIVWTVVGYTPGRFPRTEVFELPFMMADTREAACAYWTMYDESMRDEFAGVEVLGAWVHGSGLFHTADPVESPDDLRGMQIRGGSRMVNELLERVGATPVGMPAPSIAEALSRGVIDGATLPWEVTQSLRVPELVDNHTGFEGDALYTLTFVLAMNEDSFNDLPDDLRQIVLDNSGLEFSIAAGATQSEMDALTREAVVEAGNNIITIDAETAAAEWRPLVEPVYANWVEEMQGLGIDGQALIDRAQELMSGDCAQ